MKTTNTFRLVIIVIFALCSNYIHSQGVAINKTNASAHSSAMLDISSDNTGLLIPRISISNLSNSTPIDSPVESLLVYNTNITTGKGYYFWTGSEWVRLTVTNDLNFVQGSGNATEVAFWNNSNTLSSNSNLFWDNVNGYLGIGINTPSAPLSVLGNHENYVGIFINQNTTAFDATGIVGTSNSVAGNGIGVSGNGGWVGVMGSSLIEGSGDRMGVWGYANANAESKIGVRGNAEGLGTNYGVYGTASGGSENWAGYFSGNTYIHGNLGLGVSNPTAQLHNNGTVRFSNYINGYLKVDSEGNLGVSTASQLFAAGTGLSWDGSTLNSIWTASGNNIYNNNSGYVGIGTATPTNAKLHVEGSGTYDAVFRLRNIEAQGANVFFVASNSDWTFGANKLGIGLGDPSSTNVKMTVQEDGNVGIGVTSPAYKLDVSGTGQFSDQVTIPITPTADSHAASKKYVDDQVGAVLPSDNVTGSGTATRVAFWDGANTLSSNSNLYWDNSNSRLGIGISSPDSKVEIRQDMSDYTTAFSGAHLNLGTSNTLDNTGFVGITYDASTSANYGWSSGALRSSGGQSDFVWKHHSNSAEGTERMRITSTGRLGIGTNSPSAQLHTTSTVRFQNYTNGFLSVDANGNLGVSAASSLFTAGTGLSWSGTTLNSVWTASGNNISNNNSGNVGIGTTSPGQKLHVNGNIKLDDNMMVEGVSNYRVYRNLASYNSSTSTASGAFVITTNQPWNSACMFRVKIEGYFYDATAPFEIIAGGYIYTTNSFYNYGYVNIGAKQLNVRFARNISTNTVAIIIGSEGDSYSYPKLTVTSFMQGHSNINEAYADGWTIAQYTSLANFDYITTVPNVTTLPSNSNYYIQNQTASNQSANFRISGSGYIASNVGIGTTSPQAKLHLTTANASGNGDPAGGLMWIGGKNNNPDDQFINFRNPSVTDGSISGMYWWSSDIIFGRYKNETFWSFKETHAGGLGSATKDIIRAYISDEGGYQNLNKVIIAPDVGNVGIGTTTPNSKLHLYTTGSTAGTCYEALRLQCSGSGEPGILPTVDGYGVVGTSSTIFSEDRRFWRFYVYDDYYYSSTTKIKSNIEEIFAGDTNEYLDKLCNIRSIRFDLNKDIQASKGYNEKGNIIVIRNGQEVAREQKIGVDVASLPPEAKDEKGENVSVSGLQGLIIVSMKALKHENDMLRDELKKQNDTLKQIQSELNELKEILKK